jgi:hypothetical protein
MASAPNGFEVDLDRVDPSALPPPNPPLVELPAFQSIYRTYRRIASAIPLCGWAA